MAVSDSQNKTSDVSNLDSTTCAACRLPHTHCTCALRRRRRVSAGVCLIYHAEEPGRSSNTGHLVEECIEPVFSYVWSRTRVPEGLLELLVRPEWTPQLVFPGEYRAASQSVSSHCIASPGQAPLLVVIDATWNQARKILRHSPYLQQLPCVSLDPSGPSRYRLRRSRRADHLCTAEVVELCLNQLGEEAAARGLGSYLDRYSEAWLAARDNLPRPAADQ